MSINLPQKEEKEYLQNAAIREACVEFLYREAEVLDNRDLHGWLELLTDDISYEMPVRVTRERNQKEFSEKSYFFKEDYSSLQARVSRFDTEHAWSENPPSRSRRFVTNVRIQESDADAEVNVKSNILIYRAQGDTVDYDLLPAERHDVLRLVEDEFRLASRQVFFNQTILASKNLSIFL